MTDERSAPSHLPRRLFGVQRHAAEEAIAVALLRAEDAEGRLATAERQLAAAQQRSAETQERLTSVQDRVKKSWKRVREFEERLRERETELADYRRREAVVGSALIQAERIAQDTTSAARSEAEEIVAEARARAEEMLADAEHRRDDIVEFAETVRLQCRRLLEGTIGQLEVGSGDSVQPREHTHALPAEQDHRQRQPRAHRGPTDVGGRPLEAPPAGQRMLELDCSPVSSPSAVADLERRITSLPGVEAVRLRSHEDERVVFMVGTDGVDLDVAPLLAEGAQLQAASRDRLVLKLASRPAAED